MHTPDKEPNTKNLAPEKSAKQLAYIGLFSFLIAPAGFLISLLAWFLCKKNGTERTRAIARFGIILNLVIILLVLFIYFLLKESGVS